MFEGYDRKNVIGGGEVPLHFQYRCMKYFIEGTKKSDFSDFLGRLDPECVLIDIIADREVNGKKDIEKYLFEKGLTTKTGEGSVMDTIIFERPDETDKTGRTYIKDKLGILYQTAEDYYEDIERVIKFEYMNKGYITKIIFDNADFSDEFPDFELYTVDPIFERAEKGELGEGLVEYDIEDLMSEEEMIRYAQEFAENRSSDYLRSLGYDVEHDSRYHYFLVGDENIMAEKDGKKVFFFIGCSVYPETPKLNPVRRIRANPNMRMGECDFMFLGVQFSSKDPERKEAGIAIRIDDFNCKYTLEKIN